MLKIIVALMGNRVICVFYVSYRSIIDFEIVIQYNKRKHTIANILDCWYLGTGMKRRRDVRWWNAGAFINILAPMGKFT